MGRKQGPRHGSLQFWPRKKAKKILPRVNYKFLSTKKEKPGFLGFIGYKVGMKSAYVKDSTPDSMTKNKRITIPVTIIECPTMKIFSIRFYKNNKVVKEVINENIDKELKKRIKLPKQAKTKEQIEKIEKQGDFDDLRVIVYSQVKKIGLKKNPDIIELGLSGSKEDKLKIIKENLTKEISINNVFELGLVDIRGLTRGKGYQGPVKRFGVRLRVRKAEKGQRKVGCIGPWHPARISFKVPFAGQLGNFSRITYNGQIISIEKASEKNLTPKSGFKKYGKLRGDYIILRGSVQGAVKKRILITSPLRPNKKQSKKQYEFIELR